MLLVTNDFNIPIGRALPFICTSDIKYNRASQVDKPNFQYMIVDLRFIAIHSKQYFRNMFVHGIHASRIDFIFMREHQIRWTKLEIYIHYRFECIQGQIDKAHRSLAIFLSRWYQIKESPATKPPIDRYKLRHEFLGQTHKWQIFASDIRRLINEHQYRPSSEHSDPCIESGNIILGAQIRSTFSPPLQCNDLIDRVACQKIIPKRLDTVLAPIVSMLEPCQHRSNSAQIIHTPPWSSEYMIRI